MNITTPLRRREREQEADHGPKTPVEKPVAPAIRHGATWTSERVAQLESCVGTGLTCSQIAAEIGVSRNAVIGKMNRLGLSRPKTALAADAESKRTAWRAKNAAGTATGNVTRIRSQHSILMALARAPQGCAEATAIRNGPGCSLLELSPRSCRWPINEPGAADFCFCGHNQIEGLPYCPGHARIAYKSASRGSARA
jgi:GcrA cell cycle regulator